MNLFAFHTVRMRLLYYKHTLAQMCILFNFIIYNEQLKVYFDPNYTCRISRLLQENHTMPYLIACAFGIDDGNY